MNSPDIEARLRALEDRVAILEARTASQTPQAPSEALASIPAPAAVISAPESLRASSGRSVVGFALTSKRFDPSNHHMSKYEDNIWMDFIVTLAPESKP